MTSQKRAFLVLFLIVATELIGFGLIIPVLPQLASQFEVHPLWIGVLMGAYSLAQFFAAPILGALSDRHGRKPILVLSKVGTCLAYIILALSQQYYWFLFARLLDGFTGGNIAVARAYVADITSPEERPKGMAIIGISFGLGFVIGPALGGVLYGMGSGHFIPALVAGGLSLLATILTVLLLEEPKQRVEKSGQKAWGAIFRLLSVPILQVLVVFQLIYMLSFSGFETTLSVFTDRYFGFSTQDNSLLFTFAGVMAIFVQGYISRRPHRRVGRMLFLGFLIMGLGFAALTFSETLWTLLSGLALMSLGIGISTTYLPSLLSISAPDGQDGVVMGLYESIGSLGRIVGPLLAYLTIFADLRQLYMVYTIAILALALGVLATGVFRRTSDAT